MSPSDSGAEAVDRVMNQDALEHKVLIPLMKK